MGESATSKAGLIKIFATYKESKEEMDSIKGALNLVGHQSILGHLL